MIQARMSEVTPDVKAGFDRIVKRLDQLIWFLVAFFALTVAVIIGIAVKLG